ncbi:MAG: hypothetical protein OEY79_05080 [Anaplasmataceae bacterium]|nr:hypothetical protein [Anaplasmataceae bacterium]
MYGHVETYYKSEWIKRCKRLVDSLLELNKLGEDRHIVLFIPQDIEYSDELPQEVEIIDIRKNAVTTKIDKTKRVTIIYTGYLQQKIFDYLLVHSTLPPVIEGCNSIELCESMGVPFLHWNCYAVFGAMKKHSLKPEVSEMQELNLQAALFIQTGCQEHKNKLIEFLKYAADKDAGFVAYGEERRRFHLQKPDAVENALKEAGYLYLKSYELEQASMAFTLGKKVREGNPRL